MKRNNFYSQGNSVVWIITIPVILSLIIVGGGYYYLSKQIPSMPEVASRLSEEKVENKEEAEKAKVEVERLKKEVSAAAKLIEELNVQDEQIVVEIEESVEDLIPELTIPPPRATFSVRPYLVYPADKPMYPAYETAIATYLGEMQQWYLDKVGATFSIHALQIKQSSNDYITMRCGENPTQTCLDDPSKLESNWGAFINKAVHGGIEQWEQQTVALVFSAGGGGYAGGSFQDPANYLGWAIVGDWVLEPISGVANTWGIPCSYSDGWQCAEGQAIGTPAHELGHAFGLGHSPPGSNSIMINVSGYPTIGFLTNEIEYLLASPFFQ